jgi:hypothetical protein
MTRKEEIKLVGIIDWLWFVVKLKRDEFHKSLSYGKWVRRRNGISRMMDARSKAHRFEIIFTADFKDTTVEDKGVWFRKVKTSLDEIEK